MSGLWKGSLGFGARRRTGQDELELPREEELEPIEHVGLAPASCFASAAAAFFARRASMALTSSRVTKIVVVLRQLKWLSDFMTVLQFAIGLETAQQAIFFPFHARSAR